MALRGFRPVDHGRLPPLTANGAVAVVVVWPDASSDVLGVEPMKDDKREFRVAACVSLLSGKMLCVFSEMHELAEFVAGHPIWTHEFADKSFNDRLAAIILLQHPILEKWRLLPHVHTDNWQDVLNEIIDDVGSEKLEICRGNSVRMEDPIQSLERLTNK